MPDIVEELKNDAELKRLLVLEQYKQAAEEARGERWASWQLFGIIVGIEGVLAGSLNCASSSDEAKLGVVVIAAAIIGALSAFVGYFIIARHALYHKYWVDIAIKIQHVTDI